jgi:hypothetical protein
VKIHMACNPDTREIVADPDGLDVPEDWPRREADVQAKLWDDREQRLLIDWWDRARPAGDPTWPQLP